MGARKRASQLAGRGDVAVATLQEQAAYEPDAGSAGSGEFTHDSAQRRHRGLTRGQAVADGSFGATGWKHARQVDQRPGHTRAGNAAQRGEIAPRGVTAIGEPLRPGGEGAGFEGS